jgi:hypothetical protein
MRSSEIKRTSRSGPMASTITGDYSPRCSSTAITESIYIEHRGRESAVVRSTFEMVQGLKMIEDQSVAQADSTQ